MPFRIILYKKYFEKSDYYSLKQMIGIENLESLNLQNPSFELIFKFTFYRNKTLKQDKCEAEVKRIFKLVANSKEIDPIFQSNPVGNLIDFQFKIPLKNLQDFIKTGYFHLQDDQSRNVSPYLYAGRLFLKDHKGVEQFLSDFDLSVDRWGMDYKYMHKPVTRASTGGIEEVICSPLAYAFPGPQTDFLYPPGVVAMYVSYPCKNDFYLKINNFRPDEHVAFLSRAIKDGGFTYSLIHPSIIQEQLKNSGKIYFTNISHQVKTFMQIEKTMEEKYFPGIQDKLILPLPSLFSSHSEFEISQYELTGKEDRKIEYLKNPSQIFNIYTDKEAEEAWLACELSSPSRKKSYSQLNEEAKKIHCFIDRTENHPSRFDHNPKKDILAQKTLRRDIYRDEHFIHLTAITDEIPGPVTLYEVLPEDLHTKLYDMQFCWIQYNVSQTVPIPQETGFSTFNNEKLEAGKIHRSFFIDDLKNVCLHTRYGGSYFMLAAKNNQNPELWTIYTEGKSWQTLQDKEGKDLVYPYKINY